jgi:hypothetical protein
VTRQFTVRLKNEPGALAALGQALADHGIDIRNIGGGAVGSHGMVVLITNNDDEAREVFRRGKYAFEEGEVLTVSVEDHPGSLAGVARRLAEAEVNVFGVLVLGRRQGKAELSLAVDDVRKAHRALS